MKKDTDKENTFYVEAHQLRQTVKIKEERITQLEEINAVLRSKIISLERKFKQLDGAEG